MNKTDENLSPKMMYAILATASIIVSICTGLMGFNCGKAAQKNAQIKTFQNFEGNRPEEWNWEWKIDSNYDVTSDSKEVSTLQLYLNDFNVGFCCHKPESYPSEVLDQIKMLKIREISALLERHKLRKGYYPSWYQPKTQKQTTQFQNK